MRLAGFSIRNFKSIGETPAHVRLAPITLLFGPNGAGKSSLLHALHYAREIVEHANLDADLTRTGGNLDLGGFANFIYARDLDRDLVLSFDIDLEDDGLPGAREQGGVFGASIDADAIRDLDETAHVSVELTIRWSHLLSRPYVASFRAGLDGQWFAAIEASPDLKTVEVTQLDDSHPFLNQTAPDWQPDDAAAPKGINGEYFASHFFHFLSGSQAVMREPVTGTRAGALPRLDGGLVFPIAEKPRNPKAGEDEKAEYLELLAIDAYISRVMTGALVALRDSLAALFHIGPLRALPPRGYLPQRTPDPGRWHCGLAAWDRLYQDDGSLVAEVDTWLDERLKSGFGLRLAEDRRLPEGSAVDTALRTPGLYYDEELEAAGNVLYGRPVERRVVLHDTARWIDVTPHDIGVGISQVLPVIVAALAPELRLVAIEQPELHVHPRLQTELGDLLIEAVGPPLAGVDETVEIEMHPFMPDPDVPIYRTNGRTLLVETHSEHLLLRLLRHVRHTDAGDLEPGRPVVIPALIAVHYIEPGGLERNTTVTQLRISRDGDFLDEWPRGFFEERATELFS